MSISNALNNAGTGLTANSRLLDTISNNVSNALTPGYARRTLELSSHVLGGSGTGVRIVGTSRTENPYYTAERRGADASLGASSVVADTYSRIMTAVGSPGDDGALTTIVTDLEAKLIAAAANPQSTGELTAAVGAAQDLANGLNVIAAEADKLRTEADTEISRQVDLVNTTLNDIKSLNEKIEIAKVRGEDTASLEDQRHRLIDTVSSIIPVSTVKREDGHVAIYSSNGGVLLNGRVYELSFDKAAAGVTADMTVGVSLGELMQDRGAATGPVAVTAGTGSGLFDGGSLSALFEVRDRIVPEFNSDIDLYANDLIERFRDLMPAGALDGAGDGLFVDTAAGPVVGLAGRIEINAAVDTSAGGEIWRLRDGMGAAAEGDRGFGDYLQAMSDAMVEVRAIAGFASQTTSNHSAGIVAEIGTFFATNASQSEDNQAYLIGLQSTLAQNEVNFAGVDSDTELEMLMIVEQAYAANAQVLSVLDQVLQLILELR